MLSTNKLHCGFGIHYKEQLHAWKKNREPGHLGICNWQIKAAVAERNHHGHSVNQETPCESQRALRPDLMITYSDNKFVHFAFILFY